MELERPELTPSVCLAPVCRQFWKAGNYEEVLPSKATNQNGTSYLHVHPKFLHSNATSHKWVFGAIAELVDNSVDEIKNGATFVVLDKTTNPRDGTPALLIQDDGGGMDPQAMRGCLSFGFSDKKLESSIGKYGNGFKASSMRIGADVVVFSRSKNGRKITQSIGMLSYTFLMQTGHDRIVVPKVDYQFDSQNGTWMPIQDDKQFTSNLSVLLQWSPYCTLDKILEQCDKIGPQGTRIVIYNLWHDDEGGLELDFEADSKDILISAKKPAEKLTAKPTESKCHLANRLHYSLRTYLSILYLRIPGNVCILLRGQPVDYHNIVEDLQFPEFIVYKPVEGQVVTSIGFLKDAAEANIHGFNIYHRNRLILPFWHVLTYRYNRGRGVVGVLEANFIEPTHNKQDFERTSAFQRLETRLKDMALEYWDYHCALIGYHQIKKSRFTHTPPEARQQRDLYKDVMVPKKCRTGYPPKVCLGASLNTTQEHPSPNSHSGSPLSTTHEHTGTPLKSSGNSDAPQQERVENRFVGVQGGLQNIADSTKEFDEDMKSVIAENQRLHTLLGELENTEKELDAKITRLTTELQDEKRSLNLLSREIKLEKGINIK